MGGGDAMPGWYIHMDVARKALDDLVTNPTAAPIFAANGLDAAKVRDIARANPAYAALGAIGPDIFFMLPDFKPPVGQMLWKLAKTIIDVYTLWDDNFLGPFESAMGPISDNLSDEENALTGGLKDQIEQIISEASSILNDFILQLILEQYDFFGLLSSGLQAGVDEQSFFWSDMFHYRETCHTAAALWKRASDPSIVPDPVERGRFQAFALGWMSHIATDVTGHAFVNQKVGGPYRTHWQRHHLVENHMDSQVYSSDHGSQAIYDQMANAALHLWIAFNPDGSSRNNFFDAEPGPPYPPGDHSADVVGRHAVWDVDSDMPDGLSQFLSDTIKSIFWPNANPPASVKSPAPFSPLSASDTGPVSCCPTIISTLNGIVPIETGGFAEPGDISGAYFYVYKYMKFTTTDFYKIRRPVPPDVVVIPSFPSPPGSGDSDPGPGASDDSSTWQDVLSFLLDLLAWGAYLGEVAIWPASVIAGIIAGTATYTLREAIYEYMELPLYNLWLAVHSYLAMTGYVMPMPAELNSGLNTLGISVANDWQATVAALSDPDGGFNPTQISLDPSGRIRTGFPKDVVLDPPGAINGFAQIVTAGGLVVNGEYPSEFTRPWKFPTADNEGDAIFVEQPPSTGGPYVAGMNATALFGGSPGTPSARAKFEAAQSEGDTIAAAVALLPQGQHLGDPKDFTTYLVARLTRDNADPVRVVNWDLDADRGYGYLAWDLVRFKDRTSTPSAFRGTGDPGNGGAVDAVSQRTYFTPTQPGYGWSPSDQLTLGGQPALVSFNPADAKATMAIRYIGRQGKFA
jgi:hypothetical protein